MLYYDHLEELIFNRHQLVNSDQLIILSGYLGPDPVSRLQHLPFKTTVIYGMYGSDGIRAGLHSSLTSLEASFDNIDIFYSQSSVHSKCYAWLNQGTIIHALIGSANFSRNGLGTPYREVLAETTTDTFTALNDYITRVLNNSIPCTDGVVRSRQPIPPQPTPRETEFCKMTLLDPRTGEVQLKSGLNWGQSTTSHVRPNDAYIPIRHEHKINYPELFPPKQIFPTVRDGRGRVSRHNDAIDIIWDDGTIMKGLLEGSQTIEGVVYPKQIASFPEKSILGRYIRNRIGVSDGSPVTRVDLERYGRIDIDVSLEAEGIYYFDFST